MAAVDKLIDALDMTEVAGAGGVPHELLQTEQTFNPAIHRFNQVIHSRAMLGENSPFPAVDPRILASVHPEWMMTDRAEKAVSGFKAAFGPGLSRAAACDILGSRALFNENSACSGDAGQSAPSFGIPSAAIRSMAGVAGGGILSDLALGNTAIGHVALPVLRIGSVSPAEDFIKQLLASMGSVAAVSSAVLQMREVITTLSTDPFTLNKALEGLLEYRRQAIQRPNLVAGFNTFMSALRTSQGPDASPPHGSIFWQRMLCTSTLLITLDECPQGDGVTVQESSHFLISEPSSAVVGAVPVGSPADNDGDLDGLE
jgi:hypothetical protein